MQKNQDSNRALRSAVSPDIRQGDICRTLVRYSLARSMYRVCYRQNDGQTPRHLKGGDCRNPPKRLTRKRSIEYHTSLI
jgi:hypothetical protein